MEASRIVVIGFGQREKPLVNIGEREYIDVDLQTGPNLKDIHRVDVQRLLTGIRHLDGANIQKARLSRHEIKLFRDGEVRKRDGLRQKLLRLIRKMNPGYKVVLMDPDKSVTADLVSL